MVSHLVFRTAVLGGRDLLGLACLPPTAAHCSDMVATTAGTEGADGDGDPAFWGHLCPAGRPRWHTQLSACSSSSLQARQKGARVFVVRGVRPWRFS